MSPAGVEGGQLPKGVVPTALRGVTAGLNGVTGLPIATTKCARGKLEGGSETNLAVASGTHGEQGTCIRGR